VFRPGFTTSDDGTGYGLQIVRTIVDAHGWECTIAEGTDGGARFEIEDGTTTDARARTT
jgi:signal transduction histidine kinase